MMIRVAGAQIPVIAEIERNVSEIVNAIEFARQQDADILLTPEGSLSGYRPGFDHSAVAEALAMVTSHARRQGVGLALGTCFLEADGQRYDQIRFYLPDGSYLGAHNKILRCGSLGQPPAGEIVCFATTELRTFDFCGIAIGGLICNDLWANPACTPMPDSHLSQQLATMGAQIVFHAVNGGRDGSEWSHVEWDYHESNLRLRARAGGVWIVTADNCHPTNLPCSAPSGVIDPSGDWVCRTVVRGRQLFVHEIEL